MNNCNLLKIIINADDLGMDSQTNELVSELMSQKKITSATIMANGSNWEEAVRMQDIFPHCSFGVHLNLTSGRPLSEDLNCLSYIIDSCGRFAGLDSLLNAPKSLSFLQGIYDELSSQIIRLMSLGLNISHIDSHQHVHNIPSLFPVVKMLQIKFGIRRIRISKNLFAENECSNFLCFKKNVFNFSLKKIYKSYTTDLFSSFETFFSVGVKENLPGKSIELMVHMRMNEEGWSDYKMLQSNWQDELLFPVTLVSYSRL